MSIPRGISLEPGPTMPVYFTLPIFGYMCPNMFIIVLIRAETFKTVKCLTIYSIEYNAAIKNMLNQKMLMGKCL